MAALRDLQAAARAAAAPVVEHPALVVEAQEVAEAAASSAVTLALAS